MLVKIFFPSNRACRILLRSFFLSMIFFGVLGIGFRKKGCRAQLLANKSKNWKKNSKEWFESYNRSFLIKKKEWPRKRENLLKTIEKKMVCKKGEEKKLLRLLQRKVKFIDNRSKKKNSNSNYNKRLFLQEIKNLERKLNKISKPSLVDSH